jgi:hypothetical protein
MAESVEAGPLSIQILDGLLRRSFSEQLFVRDHPHLALVYLQDFMTNYHPEFREFLSLAAIHKMAMSTVSNISIALIAFHEVAHIFWHRRETEAAFVHVRQYLELAQTNEVEILQTPIGVVADASARDEFRRDWLDVHKLLAGDAQLEEEISCDLFALALVIGSLATDQGESFAGKLLLAYNLKSQITVTLRILRKRADNYVGRMHRGAREEDTQPDTALERARLTIGQSFICYQLALLSGTSNNEWLRSFIEGDEARWAATKAIHMTEVIKLATLRALSEETIHRHLTTSLLYYSLDGIYDVNVIYDKLWHSVHHDAVHI